MSFNEYLLSHPVFDFIWEIFKGVMPTIIAIFTIVVNSIINNKKFNSQEKQAQIKDIQLMNFELLNCIINVGEYLLNTVQSAEDNIEYNKYYDMFNKELNDMLKKSRIMLNYTKTKSTIYEIKNIDYIDVDTEIVKYSTKLIDLFEEYCNNNFYLDLEKDSQEKEYDRLSIKLQELTCNLEEKLYNYSVKLK